MPLPLPLPLPSPRPTPQPTTPLLFLDFDGVVLKSPKLQRYVGHACSRWLARELGGRYRDAAALNGKLYAALGHTSRLLPGVSVAAFNRVVYQELLDPAVVARLLRPDDRAHAHALLDALRRDAGIPPERTFVFSNAPADGWCRDLARALGIPDDRLLPHHYICPDTGMQDGALKPHAAAFARAEQFACQATGQQQQDCGHTCILVDDQARNTAAADARPGWRGVHWRAGADGVEALAAALRRTC